MSFHDNRVIPDGAVGVFTVMHCFVGDVGRQPIFISRPQRESWSSIRSLRKLLLCLVIKAIIYPAHGFRLRFGGSAWQLVNSPALVPRTSQYPAFADDRQRRSLFV